MEEKHTELLNDRAGAPPSPYVPSQQVEVPSQQVEVPSQVPSGGEVAVPPCEAGASMTAALASLEAV